MAVNVGSPNTLTAVSVTQDVTREEAERQSGEALPERTQMSVLTPGPGIAGGPISLDEMDPAPKPGPIES